MKVLFVIGSLSSGGAERVISEMSNYWGRKGWEITVLTTNVTKKKQDFYILDSSVKRIDISSLLKGTKIKYFIKLSIGIRRIIRDEKPNVVISFISGSNYVTILSMLGIKTPLIISDRSNPYLEKKINLKYKTFLYPFSDALVLQTKGVQSYYSNIKKINIHTIPNPVREFTYKGEEPFSSKTICSVGRLINSIKGFDLLIEAFSLISDKYKDYNLIIYGEGRDRKKLEQLVQRKNLSDRIFLPGKIKNPQQKIAHANMFVLSSLQEGFPNVLLEAMSTGLPVISFNCNYGPSEIIDNNVNGLLVEAGNVAKLSSAMEKLIQNEKLCNTIGVNAQQKVMDHFYIEKVMAKWESLINEVIQ